MIVLRGAVLFALLGLAAAECPNACSGHGDCTTFDKCVCYRNWQAADCSQRTCSFGRAYVDTPKGDLDGSADEAMYHDKPVTVFDVYGVPDYEATNSTHNWAHVYELYPMDMTKNTGHEYVECSNKGHCDRSTGLCKCFAGYEGQACNRASCPNACSGHGTCHTIEELSEMDNGNEYKLWDRDVTMGCLCDPQYTGADCSLRQCKMGIDPLYTNLATTANMPAWKMIINTPKGGISDDVKGTYAIKFFDQFGEDYVTRPIVHDNGNNCWQIQKALEGLPNSIVPLGSTDCKFNASGMGDANYAITFTRNPGMLKQIEVDTYLDGLRPTLYSALSQKGAVQPVHVDITSAGATGEYIDHFPHYCEGVTVRVNNSLPYANPQSEFDQLGNRGHVARLLVDSALEAKLLKRCLGDSNGNWEDNVDVENWDYGSYGNGTVSFTSTIVGRHPHAIKLVKKDRADIYDSGHTYLLFWGNQAHTTNAWGGDFFLLSHSPVEDDPDYEEGTEYYIFTTNGIAEQVAYDYDGDGDFDSMVDGPLVAYWKKYSDTLYTNIDASCDEQFKNNLSTCLSKGDLIFIPAGGWGDSRVSDTFYVGTDYTNTRQAYYNTPQYTGMFYKIQRIWREPVGPTTVYREDRYRIKVDKNINWDGSDMGRPWGNAFFDRNTTTGRTGYQRIFKFTPNITSTFEYVNECSNRGVCDRTQGLCNCFKGYTNDNCDTQSALAV